MKIMCTFCHNISNDNLTQWRKGEAGMLTRGPDSKFAPLLPGHVAKKLQHTHLLGGYLFFLARFMYVLVPEVSPSLREIRTS